MAVVVGSQPLNALAKANRVRLARAWVKREIAAGRVHAAAVILEPAPEEEGLPVAVVLRCQHRWGVRRARSLLSRLMISEMRPLGLLTEHQRRELADALGYRAGRGVRR